MSARTASRQLSTYLFGGLFENYLRKLFDGFFFIVANTFSNQKTHKTNCGHTYKVVRSTVITWSTTQVPSPLSRFFPGTTCYINIVLANGPPMRFFLFIPLARMKSSCFSLAYFVSKTPQLLPPPQGIFVRHQKNYNWFKYTIKRWVKPLLFLENAKLKGALSHGLKLRKKSFIWVSSNIGHQEETIL